MMSFEFFLTFKFELQFCSLLAITIKIQELKYSLKKESSNQFLIDLKNTKTSQIC